MNLPCFPGISKTTRLPHHVRQFTVASVYEQAEHLDILRSCGDVHQEPISLARRQDAYVVPREMPLINRPG